MPYPVQDSGLAEAVAGLFGRGSDPDLSYRDALRRAAEIEHSDEARELLVLAQVSGDEVLGRVVAYRAFDAAESAGDLERDAWRALVREWAGEDGDRVAALDRLDELTGRPMQLAAHDG